MAENTTIYTIGHSNVDIQEFLGLLRDNGIEVLVDVRSVPFSKYATQFNRENIEKELKKSGIEYVFIGDVLGGKPDDTSCYINGNVIYEKVMGKQWYQEGISKLIGIANRRKTAIMCSEENPNKCHRNLLISQSLLRGWLTVLHIRGNGDIEEAKRDSIQVTLQ
ncbi:MAG: DUF488 domain-containing protein [Candidatus Altiarchaeales archaeon]|nr:DUF488 domain-containing protein [Candidatus Altiarchaeota archaeon]MBU4341641.1 DUF488 domain-containing protein [Candidatus Altiarchaeota archaeon]MBU4406846.1 DUF488 domain-containing protein [Candidatus Altiarchaeota archaeon]MBU4437826.1 DUF488 domain-containing protein [Candidatus Altiarchaeota archaeon]MCG2783459.1 DUF488 domain-containing protein [Candidatus Altiarchaeales archaeon]